MEAFIFATPTGGTTSIPPPLKPLSTYEKRLTSLSITRPYPSATRRPHSKAVMAAAGFSGKGNSVNPNDIECLTCSLRLYTGYYTSEPLKKHLRDAPHCSLAQQLQQEAESKKIAESKNIVETPKIEPSSPSPAKLLGTYADRLASLDNWRNVGSKEILAAAGFRGTDICYKAQCAHFHLNASSPYNSKRKLNSCFPEAIAETAKPTPVAADIGFFDATLACDIQEFGLFCKAAGFVQRFRQRQHQYRESDLLALLPECLRGPALAWYKEQSETTAKSLSEWLEALATAFPAKTPAKSSIQTPSSAPPASRPPPQYHSCLNCSASFSSLARLLQHTQEAVCKKAVCKHCEGAFDSKNKLHEHLRQHHTKPVEDEVVNASGRSSNREGDKTSPTTSSTTTPPTSPKTTTKISISRPVTPPEQTRNPPTPPATPATPERSRLPLNTPKTTPKSVETASVNGLLTPPATPPPKLRKPQKPHLTIDDLVRMFAGKPRPFGLRQHQNRPSSPQSLGGRQSDRPSPPYQSRITAYFLPATNQKVPISQGLKSPNPKSFQQPMPAEKIRSGLPEKSAFSPYKKPGISYTSLQPRSSLLQSRSSSRSSFAWPSPPTSPPSFRSPPPDHVCCTCFGHSSFRSGPFDYLRPSQRYPWNRRPMRGIWER
ncbi:hypothetical protein G7Y79_00026g059700 [Physcia stellaris]|nr:hypothetical protein G7Y79_00026g059700 [Physcia stellaris]